MCECDCDQCDVCRPHARDTGALGLSGHTDESDNHSKDSKLEPDKATHILGVLLGACPLQLARVLISERA